MNVGVRLRLYMQAKVDSRILRCAQNTRLRMPALSEVRVSGHTKSPTSQLSYPTMDSRNPLTSRNRSNYRPPLAPAPAETPNEITFDLFADEPAPLAEDIHFSPDTSFYPQETKTLRLRDLPVTIVSFFSATYSYILLFLYQNLIKPKPNVPEKPLLPTENDEVVVIEEEPAQNPASEPDLYESFYQLDSSDDEVDESGQYGTTLAISSFQPKKAKSPKSGPFNSSNILGSNLTQDLKLLDLDVPPNNDFFSLKSLSDDYDAMVSNFYKPYKPVPKAPSTLADTLLSGWNLNKPGNFIKDEQQHIQDLITKERKASQAAVTPLSKDQQNKVYSYWSSRNSSAPVISAYSIDITVRDLLTLADGQWLNDNIIDFYLSLLTEHLHHVYCWTTHFFTTLKLKGYLGVARWAKRRKINLFEKEKVIVPINIMSTHWALAVIDNKQKSISYFDSLASRGNRNAVELLNEYMQKEAERLGQQAPVYELFASAKTPQQQNGYDCGVFTCTVAKYASALQPMAFGQKDMHIIRQRMAYEIILKSLLDDSGSQPHL